MNLLGLLTAEATGNAIGVGLGLYLVYLAAHSVGRILARRFPAAWLPISIGSGILALTAVGATILILAGTNLTETQLFLGVCLFFIAHLVGLTLMAWRSWRQPNAGPADLSSAP